MTPVATSVGLAPVTTGTGSATGARRVDLLIGGTYCLACTVKARVHQLLAGTAGEIPTQLEGLATFLLEDTTPEQAQEVLNGSEWIQVLGELTASAEPITHQVLDDLGQGMQVRHLRHLLVHTGALDEQGEAWSRCSRG